MPDEDHYCKLLSFKAYRIKLCSIGPWIFSGRKGWGIFLTFIVCGLLAPMCLIWAFSAVAIWFQYYGLAIQVIGFCLALYGVNSNLKKFGLRSIPHRIWKYFKKFPILPFAHIKHVSASVTFGGSGKLSATASVGRAGEPSIEERIKQLEQDYGKLSSIIQEVAQKHESDKAMLLIEVSKIQSESGARIDDLRSEVSEVFESSVETEILGIGLFIIGIFYATAPDFMFLIINNLNF